MTIFQVCRPQLPSIVEGRLVKSREKFADDVRRVRYEITGERKRLRDLNATAELVLRQVQEARESGLDANPPPIRVRIEIQPLSLKEAHPDARRELVELAAEARDGWSGEYEKWTVHDVKDVFDLFVDYQRRRPTDQSPEHLDLHTFGGKVAQNHAERGPFLCFVSGFELVAAYRRWGAGLLDANLRYALGATDVNRILENALKHPGSVKRFHERNNGIVLTCNACRVREDTIRLSAPQVVNGGQTLHSIATVIDDLEGIPLEQKSPEQRRLLDDLKSDLRLSARIVCVSGGASTQADQIAIASNTQNKLSDRTMHSAHIESRNLRMKLAALSPAWFAVTKDKEWEAVSPHKSLLQSKTGGHTIKDFHVDGKRYRRVDNTDLGVSLLAFWGFGFDARPSKLFAKSHFQTTFGSRVKPGKWEELSRRPAEWEGPRFGEIFEAGQTSGHAWLLAYVCWAYWKEYTFPESRQLVMAYEEEAERNPQFKRWLKGKSWDDVPTEDWDRILNNPGSCYWVEQVAKSACLVLMYESMRVLQRVFGDLDDETCHRALRLPQFADLFAGKSIDIAGDFRRGSLSDGPLTALGRILHYACSLLWTRYESQIRNMGYRHQVLLQPEWISRLSEEVDQVCTRIGEPAFRHSSRLEGASDRKIEISRLSDLFAEQHVS
ncbi:MAG: AIPR family protein [Acidobacteria bacterium]|nr:AIPR family protein [Acidobacteriota bacterium]